MSFRVCAAANSSVGQITQITQISSVTADNLNEIQRVKEEEGIPVLINDSGSLVTLALNKSWKQMIWGGEIPVKARLRSRSLIYPPTALCVIL